MMSLDFSTMWWGRRASRTRTQKVATRRRVPSWTLLIAVAGPLSAQEPSSETPPGLTVETRTLETSSGREIVAEFGTLQVPEFRGDPDSRSITLAFVRLKSDQAPDGTPTVYLAGGPGQGSTSMADSPGSLGLWAPLLAAGDFIFLDQRATGRSIPQMRMWATEPIPEEILTDPTVAERYFTSVVRSAAERFRDQGFDFRGYTTAEAAADVDALRAALGLEKINVLGFSYGTHLATAVVRNYPDRLENAVLIGVEGPDETFKYPLNMDTQFGKLAGLVASDPTVGADVPDLLALLDEALERVEREPMVVRVRNPRTDSLVDVPVGRFGLSWILRRDVGDASDLPVFPRLLSSIAAGDPSVLQWFVQRRYGDFAGINLMSQLTDAASGASPERLAVIEAQAEQSRFGNVVNFPLSVVGDAIEINDLGEGFRSPLVSDARVLMLTGSLDWNTPPYQAERMRWGMRNAIHITVENAGHEQVLNAETGALIVRFLQGQEIPRHDIVAPPMRFIPLEGHDPEVTHPSVPLRELPTADLDLGPYEGTYDFEGVVEVQVVARDGQLYGIAEGEEIRLRYQGDHTFAINSTRFVVFVPEADTPHAEFYREGAVVTGIRERPR